LETRLIVSREISSLDRRLTIATDHQQRDDGGREDRDRDPS
jgi:hypothetical protein